MDKLHVTGAYTFETYKNDFKKGFNWWKNLKNQVTIIIVDQLPLHSLYSICWLKSIAGADWKVV